VKFRVIVVVVVYVATSLVNKGEYIHSFISPQNVTAKNRIETGLN